MSTYRLVSVVDLRPIDFASGKREPLAAGEGATCFRCTRKHAIVWTVERVETREQFSVGSTCAVRAFEGWTPDAREQREARKQAKSRTAAAREARKEADVVAMVARLQALGPVPAPVLVGEHDGTRQVFAAPDGSARIWQFERGPMLAERLSCYTRSWLRKQAFWLASLDGPPPPAADKRATAVHAWVYSVAEEAVSRVARAAEPAPARI